jgi:hypothetical protein
VKRLLAVLCLLLGTVAVAFSAPEMQAYPAFPKTLINARFVYVTSYDGNELNPNVLPEDRQAIADVQRALEDWGRYIVVYRPQQADMIVAVQKRGSEDVLAVYDPQLGSTYLWRAMSRGGLDKNEMPIFAQLRQAVEKAGK